MFKYQSGRVIALGRVMLAGLFLLAVWVDRSQPQSSAAGTYGLLGVYLAFALLFAAVTWRNWWLDARLALPAHAIDMAVFTTIRAVKARAASGPSLTARERQLIELVRRGLRNRDIAAEIGVTEGTVKVYLHGIFDKFGVDNRTELAMRAPELLGR